MFLRKLCLVLVFLASASSAVGAEKEVTAVTLDGFPPYSFLKENPVRKKMETIQPGSDSEKLQGYSWDIFRESLHEMGYAIHLTVYPWPRAMHAVKSGKIDAIFPTGKNKEREEIFLYSQETINRVNFLVYVREDDPIPWEGLHSLNGRLIGVRRGFNYGYKWEAHKGIRKYEVNAILKGFKMMDKKRLDGFAGYEDNWDYALKESGHKNRYRKLPAFESADEYAAGIKTNPRLPGILKNFDIGRRKIIQNGKFDRMVKKWLK